MNDIFDGSIPYAKDNQTVSLQSFHDFLIDHQKDSDFARDLKSVSEFISNFVQDPQREVQELYLTIPEVSMCIQNNTLD